MKLLKCLFILISCLSVCQVCKAAIQPYVILPEPQHVDYANGIFAIDRASLTIAFPQELAGEAALTSRFFAEDFSLQPVLQEGKKKATVLLSLDASVLPEHPEGYILDIKPKGIVIKANTSAGILHGIQTLRQLISASTKTHDRPSLQTGTITDYPTLNWRAFMLDVSRHFMGKEVVFRLMDNMSQLKMNVFHWHLTDDAGWRIEIKKYPELTKKGAARDYTSYDKPSASFYTQEEIKEVIAYASARHITIVPEIEIPGHSNAAIASYPWLGSGDVLNLTDPAVENFLKEVLEEVIALFPGNTIHIGGDEVNYTYWKNTPSIVQYMQENNILSPAGLQIDFTNRMALWLASKNRRMMGWNEITGGKIKGHWIQTTEEDHILQQPLDTGSIVHFWRGDSALIKKTIQDGYGIVNSYSKFTYLDHADISLEKAYSFNPVPEGLTAEQQKKVLGSGCQMWAEHVPDEQDMNGKVYPRIAAYAECGWTNPEKKDYNRFLQSLNYFLKEWEKQGIKYGILEGE